ncbi:MAG: hypothetical protein IJ416_01645 [Ruminiclostridium sp.]|nr:hypothetical protein [Ruminiclostridium sp.]
MSVNLKSAFKFYRKNVYYKPVFKVITVIIYLCTLALAVVSSAFVFNEGETEREILTMLPLAFTMSSVPVLFASVSSVFKFQQSTPHYEIIIKKLIPILTNIRCLILSTVSIASAFIGVTVQKGDMSIISDVVVITAAMVLMTLISSGLETYMRYFIPMAAMIVFFTIPMFVSLFRENFTLFYSGFGIPLPVALIIFAAAYIIGTVLSFKLAERTYRKRTPLPYMAQTARR